MTDTKTLLSDDDIAAAYRTAAGQQLRDLDRQHVLAVCRAVIDAHTAALLASVSDEVNRWRVYSAYQEDELSPDGEYVQYEEHAIALAAARAERNKLSAMLDHRNDEATETERMLRAELSAAHERIKVFEEFHAADRLVDEIYDEVSPGLSTVPPEHYARLAAVVARRLAAEKALAQSGEQG